MGHENRDEGLGDVSCRTGWAPWLPEREESLSTWRSAIRESVALEAWAEVEGVIEDFGPVFFPQGVALCSRAGASVNHWATERRGIDVVVNHLNDQPTRHGVKDFLGVGVGVTLRELDLLHRSWPKQHL